MVPIEARGDKPRALISIGTNSTRLLILSADAESTLVAESRGTRLGTGLRETGHLDPQARERTLGAIRAYVEIVRERGASSAAIATSAMRRASDGAAFAADVERVIGVPLRVLGGDEEATYSFLGATHRAAGNEPVGVLDVGGGSSELAVDIPSAAHQRGHVSFAHSAEIGAVRLAEHHPAFCGGTALDREQRAALLRNAAAELEPVLAPYAAAPQPAQLIVVGGTAFTAAAMIARAPLRDGVAMTRAQREQLLDEILARSLDQRKAMPYMRPQRADILPAGLLIINEASRILNVPEVTASEEDLLAGYLRSSDRTA